MTMSIGGSNAVLCNCGSTNCASEDSRSIQASRSSHRDHFCQASLRAAVRAEPRSSITLQKRNLSTAPPNGTLLEKGAYPACLRRSEEHTSELQSRPHLVC